MLKDMQITVPDKVRAVLEALEAAGYEAYVVGGCVRDALLGRQPNDWDICTSALPETTRHIAQAAGFETYDTGIKHGTITVRVDDENFEVTTYRSDGAYLDGRHPESVEFLNDIEGDLLRRDFTVNAMAYHPERGLVDIAGGAADLEAHVLRAVGDAHTRFEEDGLRIIRALRFAATFGFEIEQRTSAAVHADRQLLGRVATERISAEFMKLLCGADACRILLEYRDVIAVFLPQLAPLFDLPQHTPYHCYDAWEHSVRAASSIEPDPTLRLAALLHDVGKPTCATTDAAGVSHFHGHPQAGAPLAQEICRVLRLPSATCQQVEFLVRYHDSRNSWIAHHIRSAIVKFGTDAVRHVFKVMRADLSAHSELGRTQGLKRVDAYEQEFEQALEQMEAFSLHDLAINGTDLHKAGIEPGPEFGRLLNAALDEVACGRLSNDHDVLMQWVLNEGGLR